MNLPPTKFVLGSDPILRFSGDGKYCFASVSLAENVSFKKSDGTYGKRVNWIPLSICSAVKDDGKQNRAQWFASKVGKGADGTVVKHSRLELRITGAQGHDISSLRKSQRNQDNDDSVDVPVPVEAYEGNDAPF
jgi:hypothetical protein